MILETSRASASPGLVNTLAILPRSGRHCSNKNCGFEFPRYVGAYPKKCPVCGEAIASLSENDVGSREITVICKSNNLRISRALQDGKCCENALYLDCSKAHILDSNLNSDLLNLFEYDASHDRHFVCEASDSPVIIAENYGDKIAVFSTNNPTPLLGFDPRKELTETAPTPKQLGGGPPSAGNKVHGRFRFERGYNKKSPYVPTELTIQNRRNAKRGLASRIKAAKAWHKSAKGRSYHRDLARYNTGNHKGEVSESAYKTLDDAFDEILRSLIVIESVDILLDAEFTEEGDIYLYFDPSLTRQELEQVYGAVSHKFEASIIGSPLGNLPRETEPADWWVVLISGAVERPELQQPADQLPAEAEPAVKGTAPKTTIVTTPDAADTIAKQVDATALMQNLSEGKTHATFCTAVLAECLNNKIPVPSAKEAALTIAGQWRKVFNSEITYEAALRTAVSDLKAKHK